MSNWVGYAVSVNCGEPLGCYQGTILQTDGTTITLTKAFRNGFPYPKSQVTLNAADIKDLKIIESRPEPADQTHSTVAVSKSHKKSQKATVCENLQANPSNSGNQVSNSSSINKTNTIRGTGQGPSRSKPIEIQASRNNKNNYNNPSGSYGNSGSTPKSRSFVSGYEKARRRNERNEACFGDSAETYTEDFDFEGNLALFDKRALWERMRERPDLVRHAPGAPEPRLRPDEPALSARPPAHATRPLRLPPTLRGVHDYVTDEGVLVPSANANTRRRLWAAFAASGCGMREVGGALLARAVADVALRLVGGDRRLEPRNAHQPPTVVALAGPHETGALALLAARLLAARGVRVHSHVAGVPGAGADCLALQRELTALTLATGAGTVAVDALPSPDLVIIALYDLQLDDPQEQYEAALSWVRVSRGCCVCVEPPGAGWINVNARASVAALLPPALPPSLGRLYLADVAPPPHIFRDLHIHYMPPFAAHSLLALHPADEEQNESDNCAT